MKSHKKEYFLIFFLMAFFLIPSYALEDEEIRKAYYEKHGLEYKPLPVATPVNGLLSDDLIKKYAEGNQETRNKIGKLVNDLKNGHPQFSQLANLIKNAQSESEQEPSTTQILSGHGEFANILKLGLSYFRTIPIEKVEETVLERTQGTTAGPILKKNPKILRYFAKVLQDEKAFPNLLKIASNRSKMNWFVILNILLFVISFLAKRVGTQKLQIKQYWSRWFKVTFIINFLRLSLLATFYGSELTPFVQIAFRA